MNRKRIADWFPFALTRRQETTDKNVESKISGILVVSSARFRMHNRTRIIRSELEPSDLRFGISRYANY
jgi:hypothetical protein